MAATYLDELKSSDRVVEDKTFSSIDFHDKMCKLGKVLAHDATKLTLACKPPRKPGDAQRMVQEMSDSVYRLVGFYHGVPQSGYQAFKASYTTTIRQLLLGVQSLCSTFMDKDEHKVEFMVPTAALWETCKTLQNDMPATNHAAAVASWKQMRETLSDVKEEVHDQGIDDDDEDEEEEEPKKEQVESEVQKQCAKLVDVAVLVFQKIERRCLADAANDNEWCDRLWKSGKELADETDVLVSQLYEEDQPVDIPAFIKKLLDLIAIAQERASGDHAKWFEVKCCVHANIEEIIHADANIDVRSKSIRDARNEIITAPLRGRAIPLASPIDTPILLTAATNAVQKITAV